MFQCMWNTHTCFKSAKSDPSSRVKPLSLPKTRSESFHTISKVPIGESPYAKAKKVQLVDKDPEKAIPLFWDAINVGDRVDSALKDMAFMMKQLNRAEEAIEAINSFRNQCSYKAQESLNNILSDLYTSCGRYDDEIALLRHRLLLNQQGLAFNGKLINTTQCKGKKFKVSLEQEASRLLGNLGWALMQQNNYIEAEDAYRRALSISLDNNKMCNLGICLIKQGRIFEATEIVRQVKQDVANGPRGVDSYRKSYERAQQMLNDLDSEMKNEGRGYKIEQRGIFSDASLGSSLILQPQSCDHTSSSVSLLPIKIKDDFFYENQIEMPQQRSVANQLIPFANSWNIDVPPFYKNKLASEQPIVKEYFEGLKGTMSRNASTLRINGLGEYTTNEYTKPFLVEPEKRETKTRRVSFLFEKVTEAKSLVEVFADNEYFEEATIATVLGYDTNETKTQKSIETSLTNNNNNSWRYQKKFEKRLKVFRDITHS